LVSKRNGTGERPANRALRVLSLQEGFMGIYVKYGNIEGDATQQGFEGWVNCHHFGWSLGRDFAKDQVGRAQNREAAQAHMNPCSLLKEVDHSSGQWLETATTDFKGQDCEIAFLRTGNPGAPYLRFKLTNALVATYVVTGTGGKERPIETITIDFTKVEIECKTLLENNLDEETIRVHYDAATGEGG
jgi:type VI secretion system secreted protein Hcp